HLFTLACRCLSADFEPVLAILADILTSPSIPEDELAIRKGEVITSIRQDDDSPAVRASETLMERLYPNGHPYGRRPKGAIATVERRARAGRAGSRAAWSAPGALRGVLAGDGESPRTGDVTARVLGAWGRRAPPPLAIPAAPAPAARQRVVIPMMNKAQA